MKLNQLFSFFDTSGVRPEAGDFLEREVTGICFDTRKVTQDSVFVAIKGSDNDGHNYLAQAASAGAIALVVENKSNVPADYPYLVVELGDTRAALDMLASRFYNYPSHELFCFGVTGTNGKTSITYILEHILAFHHKKAGVIGTVNHRAGEKVWTTQMTTPDPVTLQARLRDFVNEGAVAAAMEVSSHALEQSRVKSVNFNTVIFTNLTLDHLDYHKTMQNYFEAKQKLFTDMMWLTHKSPKFAVINIDDSYGRRLKVAEDVIAWTYGQRESDFQFKILNMNFSDTEIEVKTEVETIRALLPVTGRHTIYNIVASAVAAMSFGISLEQSLEAMRNFTGVPGRLQKVNSRSEKIVFVDYAHTPDALENVLNSIVQVRAESKLQNKIFTVFGCGGDRDKSKRPLMAKIAAKLSDFVIVTSDNPRTENPEAIVNEVCAGFSGGEKNFESIVDREQAIAKALQAAKPGDVVLIAGKGHEDYQIIGTEKRYFSDFDVAKKYLNQELL
ncbi:MAG: UDP-N-acetylmuramoylalanyl-D-glutamate--2,6-diaminopimelate ligase [Pseudobdellovibrio sp.]|jgi:UDP-N-acetylmuramoyl-L-alanyl-D-glutamate--2,6-diaminopimelate ligase|nr:UDP-N-acetylmuramoylalanyl-D-glutamate--2,6-diaminopimelate ligase [Pseudobdellovibrio sp.]